MNTTNCCEEYWWWWFVYSFKSMSNDFVVSGMYSPKNNCLFCWCFFLYQRLISVLFALISPKIQIIQIFFVYYIDLKKNQLLSYWYQWHICRRSPRVATRLWQYQHIDFSLIIWDVNFDLFVRVPCSIYNQTEVS